MISIVVPVYNAKNYIRETMEMVRKQSYRDWELLLVDDASSDGSVDRMEEYLKECPDTRIHIIKKEKNEGAAAARNTGIGQAKGRYLAFLDADDIWLQDKLELQMEFLEKKQAAFIFSAYEFGDEKAVGTGKIVHVPPKLTYEQALSRTVIFTSTVLIDTEKNKKGINLYAPGTQRR